MLSENPQIGADFLEAKDYLNDNNRRTAFYLFLRQHLRDREDDTTFPKIVDYYSYFVVLAMLRTGMTAEDLIEKFEDIFHMRSSFTDLEADLGQSELNYNEIGGVHLAPIAQHLGISKLGYDSGAHYNCRAGAGNNFGPLVCWGNYQQYIPEPVDIVAAAKVFEPGGGLAALLTDNWFVAPHALHVQGAIELLACLANSIKAGGYVLIEAEFGLNFDFARYFGFVPILTDHRVHGLLAGGSCMSVFQFDPAYAQINLYPDGIDFHRGGRFVWDDIRIVLV